MFFVSKDKLFGVYYEITHETRRTGTFVRNLLQGVNVILCELHVLNANGIFEQSALYMYSLRMPEDKLCCNATQV